MIAGWDAASAQVMVSPAPSNQQKLIVWRAGAVRCAGTVEQPIALPEPTGQLGWGGSGSAAILPVTLSFAIDASGRPHAIKRSTAYRAYSDEIEPTLASAQFAAGTARTDCTLTYAPDAMPIETAPIDALIAYSVFPSAGRLPKSAYDRIRAVASAGSTCDQPPAVRRRTFPDFKAIPQAPGTRSWSMIGFDINGAGRPTNVKLFRSTGNAALDRASVRAVADSRFEPVARRGCLYPYWRSGPTLAAPPIPDTASAEAPTCPVGSQWKTKPILRFPESYRRLGIEGWASVAYDVAPWGQTGNIRVLASEPSDAFGAAAIGIVRAATKVPSAQGYTNCVTRVRFVLDPEPAAPVAEAEGAVPAPF
ncbi:MULTISPECIES: energy transducer TonB [Sphingomonas]|uniref:energy transducer TonB n=1 Tax=Sphingomonas TaxID=13687 RepID=UPI0008327C9E|nr:TonB family protein [Sphingomonas sp. CCH10-B3]